MRTSLTLLALMATALPATARENLGGAIEWRHDLEPVLESAAMDGRPLAVYFTHDC